MKTKSENRRTVAQLLAIRPHGLLNTLRHIKSMNQPMHLYVYCRSRAIAKRFLADAEREGFVFGDGKLPTSKDTDSLFALNEELTCRYDSVYELLNYQTTTFYFLYGRNVSIQEHFRLANIDSLCILTFNSRSDGIEWIRERKDSLLNKKYSYSLADIDSRYASMSVELK